VIGGKVLDASALAAPVRGRVSAAAWFSTARTLSLPLYLPTLALAEVRAVRPDAGAQLAGKWWVIPLWCSVSSTLGTRARSTSC
jgi:hypothetical protein